MEQYLCAWCNQFNDIGYWCSYLCFQRWHESQVPAQSPFQEATPFHTGPLPPLSLPWLNKVAHTYKG